MGTVVYVKRSRRRPADAPITLAQWQALIASDPSLVPAPDLGEHVVVWRDPVEGEISWIAWEIGALHAPSPKEGFIDKLAAIASTLDADILDEEGSVHGIGGTRMQPPRPGLAARFSDWMMGWRARLAMTGVTADLPFRVGARVRDGRGRIGTVTAIDLRADHGLGAITVTLDDGRSQRYAAFAHGLEVCP